MRIIELQACAAVRSDWRYLTCLCNPFVLAENRLYYFFSSGAVSSAYIIRKMMMWNCVCARYEMSIVFKQVSCVLPIRIYQFLAGVFRFSSNIYGKDNGYNIIRGNGTNRKEKHQNQRKCCCDEDSFLIYCTHFKIVIEQSPDSLWVLGTTSAAYLFVRSIHFFERAI